MLPDAQSFSKVQVTRASFLLVYLDNVCFESSQDLILANVRRIVVQGSVQAILLLCSEMQVGVQSKFAFQAPTGLHSHTRD